MRIQSASSRRSCSCAFDQSRDCRGGRCLQTLQRSQYTRKPEKFGNAKSNLSSGSSQSGSEGHSMKEGHSRKDIQGRTFKEGHSRKDIQVREFSDSGKVHSKQHWRVRSQSRKPGSNPSSPSLSRLVSSVFIVFIRRVAASRK